tara:strand:+ start:1274 stop:1603 length:330 start_codon:yes stop_codon:yes gene_type:complete
MPVGFMGGTKRARSIPSITSSNQCGGPKKAGSVSRYHAPREKWLGGRSQQKSLYNLYPKTYNSTTGKYNYCTIPKSLQTMNPAFSGGVGRYPGAAAGGSNNAMQRVTRA